VKALRAFVVVLLACGCEPRSINFQSPTPTGAATATASAGGSSASPSPSAKSTLRPLPTASPASRLLSYERGGDIGRPSLQLLLLADGRVITQEASGELFERRLTASAAASLLLLVLGSGSFEKDAVYDREPLPGPPPPARGATFVFFVVVNGAREVRVAAAPSGQPDDNLYQPSQTRDNITKVARTLEDLSNLPATAWADATRRNYQAPFHRLFVLPQRNVTVVGTDPDVETVWPFISAMETVGEPVAGAAPWRCAILALDDARAIGDALARANALAGYTAGLRMITAVLAWRGGNGAMQLQMYPLLPHEASTCAGSKPV
jgi:hypothetical protein